MRFNTQIYHPIHFYSTPRHAHWDTNNYLDHNYQAITCSYIPPHLTCQQQRPLSSLKRYTMAQMTPSEMENFQNLSDRYQADLPGPLISEKLPMDVLVTEYAQADSAYVVKTTGLAATHGSYRAVKGDGQCGWRATVFSYFEILLNSGDFSLVQSEKIRFETYADTMRMVGIDYDLMIDMFDCTWDLFDKIMQATQRNDKSDKVILDILNDEIMSNSIVYHFKMVTSAFMKLREDDFAPFLEITVDEYRIARIDPTNQEIDQIGLQALTNAIISAAGFGLEVLYLDRSMGEEVTPHQFSAGFDGGTVIQLLYRPGHYDIIYKQTQPIQVYVQNQQTVPQYIDDTRNNVNSSSDAWACLFGPSAASSSTSYDMPYNPTGQYMQQNHQYDSYYHNPNASYTNTPIYVIPPQEPPPRSMPIHPAQQSSRTSARASDSPQSVTISPSPSATTPSANEPLIRFTSTMFNMRNYSSVPLAASSGR